MLSCRLEWTGLSKLISDDACGVYDGDNMKHVISDDVRDNSKDMWTRVDEGRKC